MRYFVDYKLHNAENDGWAYKTTKNTTDIAEAKKDYHSQLSQYIGSTAYDFVQVTLSDMYGNKVLSEYWQKPVEPHLNLNRPQIQQMKLLHKKG